MTIRGSEKSAYGKLFEKLILGTMLSILGFKYIKRESPASKMVFWLSDRKSERESDATALLKAGDGARFDIGFIGRGNPEISLDKVSRFERQIERGGLTHRLVVIILVDTIGPNSGIVDLARKIDGHIVQMSGTYWVREVADILKTRFPFYKNQILAHDQAKSLTFIHRQVEKLNLRNFADGNEQSEN